MPTVEKASEAKAANHMTGYIRGEASMHCHVAPDSDYGDFMAIILQYLLLPTRPA